MTAKQLTDSILQMAIQGKLVPQDPNDEPASVLLERIREEKRRLVEEGKLKKKDLVETPVEDDEVPFNIPETWDWLEFKGYNLYIVSGQINLFIQINFQYPVVAQNCNQWSEFSE